MAYWSECPICGEKNYYEYDGAQHFDCGFAGSVDQDTRVERCSARDLEPDADAADEGAVPVADADISDYRLAFLDAARVVESIAAEFAGGQGTGETASRCRDLAQQMRAFAGHGEAGTTEFSELTEGQGRKGTTIIDWVSRMKRW